jgi:hypothetical protein
MLLPAGAGAEKGGRVMGDILTGANNRSLDRLNPERSKIDDLSLTHSTLSF